MCQVREQRLTHDRNAVYVTKAPMKKPPSVATMHGRAEGSGNPALDPPLLAKRHGRRRDKLVPVGTPERRRRAAPGGIRPRAAFAPLSPPSSPAQEALEGGQPGSPQHKPSERRSQLLRFRNQEPTHACEHTHKGNHVPKALAGHLHQRD